jgi:hypothetical protein
MNDYPYIYVWSNNGGRSKFRKARCRILTKRRNNVLLEFTDGRRMVASLNAVRDAEREDNHVSRLPNGASCI